MRSLCALLLLFALTACGEPAAQEKGSPDLVPQEEESPLRQWYRQIDRMTARVHALADALQKAEEERKKPKCWVYPNDPCNSDH